MSRSWIGETWIDPEEAAYNTPSGAHSGSNRHGRVRYPDGKIRAVTLGIPDTYFTIPAHGRIGGRYVSGFVSVKTEEDLSSGDPIEYVFTPITRSPDPNDDSGRLPEFAWPGGYPIIYIMEDAGTLCAGCANRENGSIAFIGGHRFTEWIAGLTAVTVSSDKFNGCNTEDSQWHVIGFDVHMEGAPETCDHCGAQIESAYGDPDSPDPNDDPPVNDAEAIRDPWETDRP